MSRHVYPSLVKSLEVGCRHPLQELVVDTFVPNDTLLVSFDCPEEVIRSLEQESGLDECMHGCRSSVMICTGANACGKVRVAHRPKVPLLRFVP